jgi:hypothetical protein
MLKGDGLAAAELKFDPLRCGFHVTAGAPGPAMTTKQRQSLSRNSTGQPRVCAGHPEPRDAPARRFVSRLG